MKVFRFHHPWLIANNMCEDLSASRMQRIIRFCANSTNRVLLLYWLLLSAVYASDAVKADNFNDALFAIFQITAGSCAMLIISTVTPNRSNIRIAIGKFQNLVDDCE